MNHSGRMGHFNFSNVMHFYHGDRKLKILHSNPKTKCTQGGVIIGTGYEETAIRDEERMINQ